MDLHFKLFHISSFLHTFLEVLPYIKNENGLILHCDKSEGVNGCINAQEQHAAACCGASYWEYLGNLEHLRSPETVLPDCRKTEEKRELPSAHLLTCYHTTILLAVALILKA